MSDISTGKPMKQSIDDLSGAMAQLTVTADNSDNSSSSSKNLSDMPIDIVGMIIERSDYKEQLKLCKESKSLRALVDKQKPPCESIKVELWNQDIIITFNNHFVMYTDDEDMLVGNAEGTKIIIRRDDFLKVALDDLASALKNPKLQLEEFSVCFRHAETKDIKKFYNEIQKVLESLNHQVSVKAVDIKILRHSCLFSVLPFLKPGILKKISIFFDLGGPDWRILARMEQVALLEQWKQAEELELHNALNEFPIGYAAHFKRIQIHGGWIDDDELNCIKNLLFETEVCTLSWFDCLSTPFALYLLLGTPVSRNATEEIFHHPIPNSVYYFEIKNATKTLRLDIKKKKREIHC